MGFVIGLKCMNFVATELNLTLEQRVLWTDSQCVLGWITSLKPLPSFVANRIKEIRSSKGVSFSYIEGIQNPADVCTRGTSLFKLRSNRLWWHGPEWLQTPIKSWPTWNFPEINQNTLESNIIHDPCNTIMYETSFVVHENTKEMQLAPLGMNEVKYSTLQRLIRVTAWGLRFYYTIRRKGHYSGSLSVKELSDAKLRWEMHVQRRNFAQIFESIRNSMRNILVNQLGLFIDEQGLIRCKGRFKN